MLLLPHGAPPGLRGTTPRAPSASFRDGPYVVTFRSDSRQPRRPWAHERHRPAILRRVPTSSARVGALAARVLEARRRDGPHGGGSPRRRRPNGGRSSVTCSSPGPGERRDPGARPHHPRRVSALPASPRPETAAGELASPALRPSPTPGSSCSPRRPTSPSPTPKRPRTTTRGLPRHAQFPCGGQRPRRRRPASEAGPARVPRAVVSGSDPSESANAVRLGLMQLMSAGAPDIPAEVSRAERISPADRSRTSADLLGYVGLHRVAGSSPWGDAGLVTAEYWKSAPFFANFCDGYQLRSADPRGPPGQRNASAAL